MFNQRYLWFVTSLLYTIFVSVVRNNCFFKFYIEPSSVYAHKICVSTLHLDLGKYRIIAVNVETRLICIEFFAHELMFSNCSLYRYKNLF